MLKNASKGPKEGSYVARAYAEIVRFDEDIFPVLAPESAAKRLTGTLARRVHAV